MRLLEEVHKSKEISDAANEEKTIFLYNMTQEIRKTTNEINENADIILESDNIEENKEYAREIKGITSKFNSMTNELFDVTKMDAANIKVYNSKYNIKNVFKEIVTMYTNKSSKKTIDFRVNIDHDVPEILYGDSIRLKEILNIILDNSVKYTEQGYIEFDVNTIIKKNICRLIITIEDSGTGIKSEDIDKIKLDNKSLNKANKLITLLNGTMMISSNYGFGTKVKIILDQKIELHEHADVIKYEEIYDTIKLLMVDDSESGIKIIEKLTKGTNIKMDFATNGKECLDKIKIYDKYDIILLDEQLTQISAVELIKKIKNIRNFNTPIILLTKDNSYEYNDEYKNIGFTDYILKPVKKDILHKKIKDCVKKN
jgi:CheY-like chemotaxis protein